MSKDNDCGKFPSSGEHPAGANWPVVPTVVQVKSKDANATSQNSTVSNETDASNQTTSADSQPANQTSD